MLISDWSSDVCSSDLSLKFLWAPVIDQVRIPGLARLLGHRRSWALVTQAALILAILVLGTCDPAVDPWTTAAAALAVAFFSASQDIVIDAYRIEILSDDEQGVGAASTHFGYRVGILAAGAGAAAPYIGRAACREKGGGS